MFEKAFSHRGLDWRYLTLEIAAEQLGDAVRGMRAMGFRGGNVVGAHKQAVLPLLDRSSDSAALAGSVNLIRREDDALVGENSEGKGLVETLRRLTDPAGKRIALLGAGGMAKIIAIELAIAGAAEIRIVNRTEARAQELVALLAGKFPVSVSATAWEGDYQTPADIDVLIDATSVGQGNAEAMPPLGLESLRPELIVASVSTDPPRTRLLREAAQRGCRTIDGLDVFLEQAAIGFQAWTGIEPDRGVMREAVEEFLEL
jgi:shikimate dehydrogenase